MATWAGSSWMIVGSSPHEKQALNSVDVVNPLPFCRNIGQKWNLFTSSILGTSFLDSEALTKRYFISLMLEKKSFGATLFQYHLLL